MRYKENYRSIERQCFFFIFFFAKIKLLFLLSLPLSSSLCLSFLPGLLKKKKCFFVFFVPFFSVFYIVFQVLSLFPLSSTKRTQTPRRCETRA